jgi:hypothetical protein
LNRERPKPDHRRITEDLRFEARLELHALEDRRAELASERAASPGRRDLADSLAAVEQRLAR